MLKISAFVILALLLLSCGYAQDPNQIRLTKIPFFEEKKREQEQTVQEKPPIFVRMVCRNVGFFSTFMSAIGLLDHYDRGMYQGIKIDFGSNGNYGLYHDPSRGRNWWNYYFKPILLGNKKAQVLETVGESEAWHTEFELPRKRVNELIRKYVRIRSDIKDKVKQFTTQYFNGNYVIGIHFRETDKCAEVPIPSGELCKKVVDDVLAKTNSKKVKIFVATDVPWFLDYLKTVYSSMIISYDCFRSVNGVPVHFSHPDNYAKGEEALIDCLLLSKCNYLIKSSSNLSLCAAYFNPEVPMIHLSMRTGHPPLE